MLTYHPKQGMASLFLFYNTNTTVSIFDGLGDEIKKKGIEKSRKEMEAKKREDGKSIAIKKIP